MSLLRGLRSKVNQRPFKMEIVWGVEFGITQNVLRNVETGTVVPGM